MSTAPGKWADLGHHICQEAFVLAIAAAVVFLLALLKVSVGSVSLLYLGLLLLSLHLAFPRSVGLFGRKR